MVAGFERYLVTERGLLPRTAAAQAARVRRFQIHLHADMTIKENAIAKITPQDTATAGHYQPSAPPTAVRQVLLGITRSAAYSL